MDEEFLSLHDVAEKMGVTYMTAFRWAKRGKMAYIKISPRSIRVRKADFETFLQKRTIQPTDDDLNTIIEAL